MNEKGTLKYSRHSRLHNSQHQHISLIYLYTKIIFLISESFILNCPSEARLFCPRVCILTAR